MKSNKKDSNLRVQVLSQALPYIQKFRGEIFVIKYGGSAMSDPELKKETIKNIVLLSCVGIKLVLVHGGGPEISVMSKRLNLPVRFVDGYRVTDKETMEIVEMVLVGKVQKDLVNLINVSGGRGIGLCGKDGKLFSAKPISKMKKYGFIGEAKSIDTDILFTLLEKGFIPVISSVGTDQKGQNYNINADNVASSIASAIKASKLILMTDTPGILKNSKKTNSLISKMSASEAKKLIKNKNISGGMIPKAIASINALNSGVNAVHIIDGNLKYSVLLEIFTDTGIGTMIVR
ncbi:MAG: acetylglutamate kinase [Candidatus Melainabacteria bacterium RIFCSPLOWO2_02_FULL_35_15]|nr:MAG: acetylglutamate kinase [Candidatus Melainabacteria bacterium RIFCSPLOWO2_12_FULL_35_11]OGI13942.1 MAG: acetylglutamate kinase [Candidatus Melainabacteria bacterium RIFCSPLOWO2_02_FULL_35_15]